jgi:hypothetical protein
LALNPIEGFETPSKHLSDYEDVIALAQSLACIAIAQIENLTPLNSSMQMKKRRII